MRRSLFIALLMMPLVAVAAGKGGKSDSFDEHFRKYSKHYFGIGADWHWFKSQAMAESNLDPQAQSGVKARGLMQLMPATYAELQKKNPELGEITDPRWNIAAGISYDRQLWDRLRDVGSDDERRRFMFAAYNAGPTTIRRARQTAAEAGQDPAQWNSVTQVAAKVPRWRHAETLGYISKIERFRVDLGDPRAAVSRSGKP